MSDETAETQTQAEPQAPEPSPATDTLAHELTLGERIAALHAKTDVSNQTQIQFRELVEIVRDMAAPGA